MTAGGSTPIGPIRLRPAGFEYGIRQGTRMLEVGFNTEEQALIWAEKLGLDEGTYWIDRRPVGLWEHIVRPGSNVPKHVDMDA